MLRSLLLVIPLADALQGQGTQGAQGLVARDKALGRSALLQELESQSALDTKLVLVPPPDQREEETTFHVELELKKAHARQAILLQTELGPADEFQPSEQFQAAAGSEQAANSAQGEQAQQSQSLPWGVQSPKTHDNLPVFQVDYWAPWIEFPKEIEYSLEAGDTIKSFGSARQDVKLITQVLFNITNGFYLDTHAGDGEMDSNTMLLELMGWRGLILEPRTFWYVNLWSKFRKAWLFMGAISPTAEFMKIGFDDQGRIDMLSGHRIHAYPLTRFLAEMGPRKTVDFWNLNNGGYEFEVLNETLLGSGKDIEFGVVMVTFDGRRTGRGWEPFVLERSRDDHEQLIFEVIHKKGYKYIGGLDAYWINTIYPRFYYKDYVFVNPEYFSRRDLYLPTSVKSVAPPKLNNHNSPWDGFDTWDSGFSEDEEADIITAYIQKSQQDAAAKEQAPKAHRVGDELKIL